MVEYIRKDVFMEKLELIFKKRIEELENIPHWIPMNDEVEGYEYVCSECEEAFEVKKKITKERMTEKYKFCPYCGSKMNVFVSQDEDGYLQAVNKVFDVIRDCPVYANDKDICPLCERNEEDKDMEEDSETLGEWLKCRDSFMCWECSECSWVVDGVVEGNILQAYPYCPHCGTKMISTR